MQQGFSKNPVFQTHLYFDLNLYLYFDESCLVLWSISSYLSSLRPESPKCEHQSGPCLEQIINTNTPLRRPHHKFANLRQKKKQRFAFCRKKDHKYKYTSTNNKTSITPVCDHRVCKDSLQTGGEKYNYFWILHDFAIKRYFPPKHAKADECYQWKKCKQMLLHKQESGNFVLQR